MLKNVFNLRSVLLGLYLTASSIITHAQPYAWVKGLEGFTITYDIATDAAGNVYITGSFTDTVDFDPGPGVANLIETPNSINESYYHAQDIFIAKYDALGNYVWAKSMVGRKGEHGRSIAIDKYNNIYITGMYRSDTLDLDPGPGVANVYSFGGSNIFFAKYDSDGNCLWAKGIPGSGGYGFSIAVDDVGDLCITGKFATDKYGLGADFDPGAGLAYIRSGADLDAAYFAKYDTDGNYVWATCLNHTRLPDRYMGGSTGYSVALDRQGNAYFTGRFNGFADFDPGSDTLYLGVGATSPGKKSGYIVKYDPKGNFLWAQSLTGTGSLYMPEFASIYDVVLDEADNIFITGGLTGVVDFDRSSGIAIVGTPGFNSKIFLAKYDKNGDYLWTKTMGNQQMSYARAITRNGNNLYITGQFNGILDFDPGPGVANLRSLGGGPNNEGDIFIAKYDTSGRYLCAQAVGGLDADDVRAITTDNKGRVYVTGIFYGTADFDPGPAVANLVSTSATASSAFILKLACKDSINRLDVSLCSRENGYTLNDSTYTASGMYTQVIANGSSTCGCDSAIQLNLTFGTMVKPEITIDKFTLGLTSTYTTYQWFKDGVAIPGATGSKYVVSENADYTVVVTNDEGCGDTSAIYSVTNTAIRGLADIAHQISIYPNPATDLVYIQRPAHLALNIRVTGIEGKRILNAGNAWSISLKELASGIYFITIADQEGNLIKIEKLVKQ